MAIWRMFEVKTATGHRSHASIYNAIHAGLFTKPVLIGRRAVGWPSEEVLAINAMRIAGKSDSEIRELVNRLHVSRVDVVTVYEPSTNQTTLTIEKNSCLAKPLLLGEKA